MNPLWFGMQGFQQLSLPFQPFYEYGGNTNTLPFRPIHGYAGHMHRDVPCDTGDVSAWLAEPGGQIAQAEGKVQTPWGENLRQEVGAEESPNREKRKRKVSTCFQNWLDKGARPFHPKR